MYDAAEWKAAVTRTDFSWPTPAILCLLDQCPEKGQLIGIRCCYDEAFVEENIPAQIVLSSIID